MSFITTFCVAMTVIVMLISVIWQIYRDYWNMDDYDEHKISETSMTNLSSPAYLEGPRRKFYDILRGAAHKEGMTVLVNVTPQHFIHPVEEDETSERLDGYIKRGNIDFLVCNHEGYVLTAVYYKLSGFESTKNTERAVRHILKRMYIPVIRVKGKKYEKLAKKIIEAAKGD